jgi:alkylhydroperoxidase family enzyme
MRASTLEEMKKFHDEGRIVELRLDLCFANFTNRFNDALQYLPDIGV